MQVLGDLYRECDAFCEKAFTWRDSLSVGKKVTLAFATALLIGLAAQVRLPLPGTPVPVTGQVFAVLLCGVFLGGGYGALSQLFYIGLGAMGLPVFSGLSAGSAILLGVTGGYIVGFIPAVLMIGLVANNMKNKNPLSLACAMLSGVGIIYLFGAAQFAVFTGAGMFHTLTMAVIPFIAWDIVKALVAAYIACLILPKNNS